MPFWVKTGPVPIRNHVRTTRRNLFYRNGEPTRAQNVGDEPCGFGFVAARAQLVNAPDLDQTLCQRYRSFAVYRFGGARGELGYRHETLDITVAG